MLSPTRTWTTRDRSDWPAAVEHGMASYEAYGVPRERVRKRIVALRERRPRLREGYDYNPRLPFPDDWIPEWIVEKEEKRRKLADEAMRRYALGHVRIAEKYDAQAEQLADEIEGAMAGMEEGSEEPDREPENYDWPEAEIELAQLYAEYLNPQPSDRFTTTSYEEAHEPERAAMTREQRFAEIARHVLVRTGPLEEGVSDEQLVAAAQDAYEHQVALRGRLRERARERTPNPIMSARNYEILVAQRADPRIEIQNANDAAQVARFTSGDPKVAGQGTVERTLVALAREAMLIDQRTVKFSSTSGRAIGYEDYWAEIRSLVAYRGATGWDADAWDAYLTPLGGTSSTAVGVLHPFLETSARQADVLRHTAHLEALVTRKIGGGPLAGTGTLTGLLRHASRASMAADLVAASAQPQFIPNASVEERLLPENHPLSHRRTIYPTWTPDGKVRLEYLGEGGCPVASFLMEPPTGRGCDWIIRDWNGKIVARLPRTSVRLDRLLAAANENMGTVA